MPSRVIAHQIRKTQHSEDAQTYLREDLLPTSSESNSLVEDLRLAITRGNPVAGKFTRRAGGQPPFEQRLSRYMRAATDDQFVAFSRDAVGLLVGEMRREPLTTGGYVVFAEHEFNGEVFLLVVLLSTRAQPSFDEQLNLVSATTLDVEHLRHAGRVRENGVAANEDGVVHFVSRASEGIFFKEFLGCEAVTDPSAQANYLLTALRGWSEEQEMDIEQRESMMQRTYAYWNDRRKAGEQMTLTGLSNFVDPENPNRLLAYLGSEDTGLAGEFSPPRPESMRQFVKFAFQRAGLKIEFDRNAWLQNINVKGSTVTIRNAPAELIQQINEEKNPGG
jgi:nucleoid-associated protein